MSPVFASTSHRMSGTVATLLLIEFLDELVFGVGESAWPLIRADLRLDYIQIGLLLSLPGLLAAFTEPVFGILADRGHKRWLILVGGLCFGLATLLTGLAPGYGLLLFTFILFFPASGAFVSVAQAVLMDLDPRRRELHMARWTLAGSVGVVAGPLLLTAFGWLGGSWRTTYLALAAAALLLVLWAARARFSVAPEGEVRPGAPTGVRSVLRAFARRDVQHWLILLMCADFMLDVLLSYLALYFVDVAGGTPEQGALAVGVFTSVGLLSDALLIPLLTRVSGRDYLRWSVSLMVLVFPVFLLVPGLLLKLILIGLIGVLNAGWYAILKAQMYGALPGQSGTVLAVDSIFGFVEKLVPLAVGLLAASFGLGQAIWVLWLGPLIVWLGVFRPTGSGGLGGRRGPRRLIRPDRLS